MYRFIDTASQTTAAGPSYQDTKLMSDPFWTTSGDSIQSRPKEYQAYAISSL